MYMNLPEGRRRESPTDYTLFRRVFDTDTITPYKITPQNPSIGVLFYPEFFPVYNGNIRIFFGVFYRSVIVIN